MLVSKPRQPRSLGAGFLGPGGVMTGRSSLGRRPGGKHGSTQRGWCGHGLFEVRGVLGPPADGLGGPVSLGEGLGEPLPLGEGLGEPLPLGEGLGEPLPLGEGLGEPLPLGEGLGEPLPLGEGLGEPLPLGEGLGEPLPLGEGLGEPLPLGEGLGEAGLLGDCEGPAEELGDGPFDGLGSESIPLGTPLPLPLRCCPGGSHLRSFPKRTSNAQEGTPVDLAPAA
ncbi:hypothetical protein SAMN05421505_14319 [Sinosporangium album]|uniref:Uncharacterized protein n=1 Tax=Sinosporangium album TaxID=504805 RepID=A0A1G8JGV4_9ACTN|nr:hypothetical protein SAMN05421505_14319 [Sinosporangium album]